MVIGDNVNIGRAQFYAGDDDNLEIIIGDNFLSAVDIYVRNSDGHTIFDVDTMEILNESKFGIHIGNHVWAGYNVTILKDACIPNNCVLGACSVVGKGDFPENSILAGTPAKTIRTGINWDPCTISRFNAKPHN